MLKKDYRYPSVSPGLHYSFSFEYFVLEHYFVFHESFIGIYLLVCNHYLLLIDMHAQAEGIFRINADNGQEEFVRNQLNAGVVPIGIDVHCLAGLIKVFYSGNLALVFCEIF